MMRTAIATAIAFLLGALTVFGINASGGNDAPRYGATGLPRNCRAIVQVNIDAYRRGSHTADEVMESLEQSCGAHGHAWGE